jgi:membrane protease YdiL (CAAX protease family)
MGSTFSHLKGAAMSFNESTARSRTRDHLVGLGLPYACFCGLGLISRFVPALFIVFVLFGIAFPLLWAKRTHNWSGIGFSKRNLGQAFIWGIAAGIGWGLYTFVMFGKNQPLPPKWGLQVALAIPIWLLVLSPFREFFFRGWFQPRLQAAIGKWRGLLTTALAFTLWHYFPKFEGTSTASLPLSSLAGIVSTFGLGLLMGFIHQRTRNIVAPWLAHAIGGIALVMVGGMSFVQS